MQTHTSGSNSAPPPPEHTPRCPSVTSHGRFAAVTVAPMQPHSARSLPQAFAEALATMRARHWRYGGLPQDFGIAAYTFVIALVASVILQPLVPEGAPFVLFAAVVISASLGGQRAGWTSVGLSTLAYCWFLLHPTFLHTNALNSVFSLCIFLLVSLLASAFCDGLYTAQKSSEAARAEAETLARRSLLLAQAGKLLDEQRDQAACLQEVAQLAAERLGDWCSIDLEQEESRVERVAVAHRKSHLTAQIAKLFPSTAERNSVPPYLRETLWAGKAQQHNDVPAETLFAPTVRRENAASLPKVASLLCIPLGAQGQTFGALTLASENPERRYTPLDLEVARELAVRIALTIKHNRLYQAAQQELEERKRAEARVQVLNDQLQLAMTETHHRVKNNLQLISAILDMRLMDGAETFPAAELKRLSNYVRTLAVVHNLLTYAAKNEGQAQSVSAQSALQQLLSMMQTTSGETRITYQIDEAVFSTKQCTSLALITNELVSNAIKHGQGEVNVTFTVNESNAFLDVYDNGPGFPPDFDALQSANTGLELIDNLIRWDLNGHVLYKTAPAGGGHVHITIPLL